MFGHEKYGIEVGQLYESADGTKNLVRVTDVTTFEDCDDIVVLPLSGGDAYRIDAFKLAMVRYNLVK